jgi:hypothetical protein
MSSSSDSFDPSIGITNDSVHLGMTVESGRARRRVLKVGRDISIGHPSGEKENDFGSLEVKENRNAKQSIVDSIVYSPRSVL